MENRGTSGVEGGVPRSEVFAPKRDVLLGVLVWAPVGLAFVLIFLRSPLLSLVILPALLLVASVWLSTRYTITPKSLDIRCGPFRTSVPLDSIRSVAPSRSILAAPALSLDRIKVDFGRLGDHTLIAPRDRRRFVRSLRKRCPSVQIDQALSYLTDAPTLPDDLSAGRRAASTVDRSSTGTNPVSH